MSLYCAQGGPDRELSSSELRDFLSAALAKLGRRRKVLAVPPDQTRTASRAGELTRYAWEYYGEGLSAVLPALGTHKAMSAEQIAGMFGNVPPGLFHVHKWRDDVETIGVVPREFIHEQSEGKLDYEWPAQVNRLISRGEFDLILSIGQVVPHEVIGMANYNKNILVGTGGPDSINRSHYLGAVYGMERIMGRADNPVRRVLNYAASHFLIEPANRICPDGREPEYFRSNCGAGDVHRGRLGVLSGCCGVELPCELHPDAETDRKAVVYLDPHEFHSTWLGNKAIYRTRMAMADGGELIILAPGVRDFGEDVRIDKLIRKYGYHGTDATITMVKENADLAADLSAAAHLIHGSSEGRFRVTWCPGHLTRKEVEGAGFEYAELSQMMQLYDPAKLPQGPSRVAGEEIYFIENPGLGLWASRDRF